MNYPIQECKPCGCQSVFRKVCEAFICVWCDTPSGDTVSPKQLNVVVEELNLFDERMIPLNGFVV